MSDVVGFASGFVRCCLDLHAFCSQALLLEIQICLDIYVASHRILPCGENM